MVGNFCTVVDTNDKPILLIFHNYAYLPSQHGTIHSKIQIQDGGSVVCDTSTVLGGLSRIDTPCGRKIPLCFRQALPYIRQRLPTEEEMLNLDQVIMTKEEPWDPSKYDDMHLSNEELTQRIPSTPVSSTN